MARLSDREVDGILAAAGSVHPMFCQISSLATLDYGPLNGS